MGFVGVARVLWVESRVCIVLWVKPRRGRLSPELGGKGPSEQGPGLWAGPKPHTGVFRDQRARPGAVLSSGLNQGKAGGVWSGLPFG